MTEEDIAEEPTEQVFHQLLYNLYSITVQLK